MSFLINPFTFAVAGGDFESIATVTVGSGGASSIEFTSIGTDWQHLQVRMVSRTARAGADDYLIMQLNSDTGSNYAYHVLIGDGSSASAAAGASQTSMFPGATVGNTATASVFGAAVVDILDYDSTSKAKTIRSVGSVDRNGAGEVRLTSGLWTSTNAITSIKFTTFYGANWAQHTTAALFGVKAP